MVDPLYLIRLNCCTGSGFTFDQPLSGKAFGCFPFLSIQDLVYVALLLRNMAYVSKQ